MVQAEEFTGIEGNAQMAVVDRVEGPTKNADGVFGRAKGRGPRARGW
jgi:hypothetical protein